jgi:hypothetical protein
MINSSVFLAKFKKEYAVIPRAIRVAVVAHQRFLQSTFMHCGFDAVSLTQFAQIADAQVRVAADEVGNIWDMNSSISEIHIGAMEVSNHVIGERPT